MAIKQKPKEELQKQIEGFLEYEEKIGKIEKTERNAILEVFLKDEDNLFKTNKLKEELSGILSSNETAEDFQKEYVKYLGLRKKFLNILPNEYHFLLNDIIKYCVKNNIKEPEMQQLKERIDENIKKLNEMGFTSFDDVSKLCEIIIKGNGAILNIFNNIFENEDLKTNELLEFKNIILGVNKLERFYKQLYINNLKLIFEILKDFGLKGKDDLIYLKGIIEKYSVPQSTNRKLRNILNILFNLGIKSAKELGKLEKYIYDNGRILMDLEETLKGLEVKSTEKLIYLCELYLNNGINTGSIKKNIQALKESGITKVDDLVEFTNVILKGINTGSIKKNIQALKESGITKVDDLAKFQDIILKYWQNYTDDNRPIPKDNHQEDIKNNILELKELGITEVDDLAKFQDIILTERSIIYRRVKNFKENILALKDLGITKVDDLIHLKDIINHGKKENILVLKDLGITEVDYLASFNDIITDHYVETKIIKRELDILYYERNIQSPKKLSKYQKAILFENISKYKEYFGNIKDEEINDIDMKVLSSIRLPENLEFKENNHKGYLKFIGDIIDTDYNDDKKSKIIKKIVTHKFDKAEKYLEVFKMLDTSISMDVQRVKNELIDEVLESEEPEETVKQIIDIFEKNNLPLTGKIYKVFELLYPIEKFKYLLRSSSGESTLGSPVLNDYIERGKENSIYKLIYKDLMNIAIKSGDHSLKEYLNTFVLSESLLKKFEGIVRHPGFNPNKEQCLEGISSDEKEQLRYLFKKIEMLSIMFLGKELKKGDKNDVSDKNDASDTNDASAKNDVSDKDLIDFYNEIKEGFNLRNGKSIYDKLQKLLCVNGLGYHSASEVLEDMNRYKKQAHERGLKLYNEANGKKIAFPKHAFLKGIDEDVFPKIIDRGVTSREYLGGGDDGNAAGSDCTPFDIDGLYVDSSVDWRGYGDINLIIDTNRCNIVDTSGNNLSGYKENQYELFKTGVVNKNHYGIRTGIPTTEIDYIIYKGSFKEIEEVTVKNAENPEGEKIIKLSKFQKLCYEIAKNGYYIPITDSEGNIKFTPEMYHNIRKGFNYMQYYDGFDVGQEDGKWVSKESDNEVHKKYNGTNEKIREQLREQPGRLNDLIADNSPSNENYREFAKENGELAKNTIKWLKEEILEKKCGIKFNSEHDSSITGAEIHDSGSTGRGTDIPTKDVDLDFTLLLDANDYKRVDEIRKIIHKEIGTKKDDDHGVIEGGNQIKSKINNIGKSDKRPNGVPLDLLILKKSQVINYSSSDAMKEKLDFIASNPKTGAEDSDFVRTNVIIMKKLLKAKGCYKKPEGGISGIGVENRITQHHGSFIEALESFEKVAYKGKCYEPGEQPISLEEFQKKYPMYDAGENYKDGGNDNFVYKLKEKGYKGMLSIAETLRTDGIKGIEELIGEYERKKAKYTN